VPYGVKGDFFPLTGEHKTDKMVWVCALRSWVAKLLKYSPYACSLFIWIGNGNGNWGNIYLEVFIGTFFLSDFSYISSFPTRACCISTFRCCFFVFLLQMVLHFIFILFLWKRGAREYERMGTYTHSKERKLEVGCSCRDRE